MNADKSRVGRIPSTCLDRRRIHLRLSAFIGGSALLVTAATASAQTLFKCTTPAGKVVYQQEKCDDSHRQSTVRPPDPPAPKSEAELRAASSRDAKAAELQMGQVAQVMADMTLCAEAQGWEEKHMAVLREWKSANGQAIAKFDQDKDAYARAAARVQSERAKFATNKSGLMDRCESFAASLRKTTNQKN